VSDRRRWRRRRPGAPLDEQRRARRSSCKSQWRRANSQLEQNSLVMSQARGFESSRPRRRPQAGGANLPAKANAKAARRAKPEWRHWASPGPGSVSGSRMNFISRQCSAAFCHKLHCNLLARVSGRLLSPIDHLNERAK
jgi:hypothetical protein